MANAGGLLGKVRLGWAGLARGGAAGQVWPRDQKNSLCLPPPPPPGILGKLQHADKIGRTMWHEILEVNVTGA